MQQLEIKILLCHKIELMNSLEFSRKKAALILVQLRVFTYSGVGLVSICACNTFISYILLSLFAFTSFSFYDFSYSQRNPLQITHKKIWNYFENNWTNHLPIQSTSIPPKLRLYSKITAGEKPHQRRWPLRNLLVVIGQGKWRNWGVKMPVLAERIMTGSAYQQELARITSNGFTWSWSELC